MSNKLGQFEENNTTVAAKKRGRKSKKEIEEAQKLLNKNSNNFDDTVVDNIVVKFEEPQTVANDGMSCINEVINSDNYLENDNDGDNPTHDNNSQHLSSEKLVAKKRGRKPKGGKIIQQIIPLNNIKETKPNVILHLKCCLKDLNISNLFGSNLDGYSFSHHNNLFFDHINNENNNIINASSKLSEYEDDIDSTDYDANMSKNKDSDIREIWKKLKILEHNLHINNTDNKKSACFWDTCEFDNPPVYIPKHFMNDTYQVYGCFCSPECAVAHLMEENIDSSIKFERYQLMNHIYSKVYNYSKNIKPAPNPYYMLEKYYGNLSIQEFRSLLRNERLFLVVDKPLTRVMPELHEDNDDFIINNKIIPTNNIKLRKLQKKQTKINILSERFGLTQS